jgi:hypothetical protein
MATHRTGAVAQGPISAPDHVPVRGTNRSKFVKRKQNAARRQDQPHGTDQIDANRLEVMEMHDIRLDRAQQFDEGFDQQWLVIAMQPGVVVGLMQQPDTIPPLEAGNPGPGLVRITGVAIHRGEHGALDRIPAPQFVE